MLLLSGCSSRASRASELRDAAHSLLPEQHRILLEELGDCVELARSPSCVQTYFLADSLALGERVSGVEQRASAAAWKSTRKERLAGGVELRFRRGKLGAIVTLHTDDFRRDGCDRARAKDCGDVISVERG